MFFIFVPESQAQLSGNYTIGGTTPDFATFNDAVDSLKQVGVSTAVTFNVRSGFYGEQFHINEISGASSSNRITFQ